MSNSLVHGHTPSPCPQALLPRPVTAPVQCPFKWEPLTMTDVLLELLLLVPR